MSASETVCAVCGNRCMPVREWLVSSASKTAKGTNDGRFTSIAHHNKGDSSKPVTVRLRIDAQGADFTDGEVCLACLRAAIVMASSEMVPLL